MSLIKRVKRVSTSLRNIVNAIETSNKDIFSILVVSLQRLYKLV